jgi:organic hydroperoxide reductase OsmC/OhrA
MSIPEEAYTSRPWPAAEELAAIHHAAHDKCYIANSLKAEVVVEAPPPR